MLTDGLDFRQRNLELLSEMIGVNQVIPFIGAGLSIPFEYPGWTEFLLSQADAFGMRQPVQALIDKGLYEEAASTLMAQKNYSFTQKIADTYATSRAIENGDPAIFALPRFTPGPVVTTNFDSLVESVYRLAGKSFEKIFSGGGERFVEDIARRSRCLIRIHGEPEDRQSRVLTSEEYNHHYCSDGAVDYEKPLSQSLLELFLTHSVLFIGCSLNKDRYLNILEKVVQNTKLRKHFALVEEPGGGGIGPQKEDRAALLAKWNIYPIWYPNGRHNSIRSLLDYVCSRLNRPTISWTTKLTHEARFRLPLGTCWVFDLLAFIESHSTELEKYVHVLAQSDFVHLVPASDGSGRRRELTISKSDQDGFQLHAYPSAIRVGQPERGELSVSLNQGGRWQYFPKGRNLNPSFVITVRNEPFSMTIATHSQPHSIVHFYVE